MGRLVDIDEVILAVDKHTKDESEIVLDEDITVILEEVPTAHDEEIRNKVINDVMKKANEIQKEQIKNLKKSPMRNGKRWAIYMNTYLGHIQVACKRLLVEQLHS